MPDLPQIRRLKRRTTILILIVFIYNTSGFLLIQPSFTSYFEFIEPGEALEEELQFDDNALDEKERPPDNYGSGTGYSEPVRCLTPGQIYLQGSIYINNTSVHYIRICRAIPTPPPQLI